MRARLLGCRDETWQERLTQLIIHDCFYQKCILFELRKYPIFFLFIIELVCWLIPRTRTRKCEKRSIDRL